jgi:parvulin-like peptidyl-prolyl isomerase
MKVKKQLQKIFLVLLVNVLLLPQVTAFASSRNPDKPLASGNGTVLVEKDLGEYMQRVFPGGLFHKILDPEKMAELRKKAIDLMIDDELLYQLAKNMGLKVKQEKVDEAEEKVIKRLKYEARYKAALKQRGMTRDEFRKNLEKDLIIEKLLKQEVEDKATMSDADAKAFYETNKKTYKRPATRHLSHILIKVAPDATSKEWEAGKKRAEEVRAKIVNGADFGDMAWDYSNDPYRVKGGDLGLVHKGRLIPDLEAKVWKLKKGELSPVIKTIYGYHIVRVDDILPSKQMTFDEVKEKIKKDYYDKKSKELKDALLAKVRKNAKIIKYEK